jgi:hypothetical protein
MLIITFTVKTLYISLSCLLVDRVTIPSTAYRLNVRCTDCINWGYDNGNSNGTIQMARENSFFGPPFPGLSPS